MTSSSQSEQRRSPHLPPNEDNEFLGILNRVLDISSPIPPRPVHVSDRVRKDKNAYRANTVNNLKTQVLRLKKTLRSQQEDQEILKEYTVSVMLSKEEIEKDLAILRSRYSEELAQAKASRLHRQDDQNELSQLKSRLVDAERFILALLDLGLEPAVLREAVSSVLTGGQHGEDALINAVRAASANENSSAARSRTPDHYLAALELTISARKELKEKARYAQFWKTVARSDPANATVVTPSPSDLDQLTRSTCLHKPSVGDDLVHQLRDALSAKPSVRVKSAEKAAVADLPSRSHPKCQPSHTRKDGFKPRLPAPSPPSLEQQRPSALSKRPGMKASTGLRDELVVSTSMQSLSGAAKRLSDPNLSLWLLPGKDSTSIRPPEVPSIAPPILLPSIISGSPPPHTHSKQQLKRMSFPLTSSPPHASRRKQLNTLLASAADSSTGTLRACQALLSLERICAGLSSSSLGSLSNSEDEPLDLPVTHWFTNTGESNSVSSSANDSNSISSNTPEPATSFAGLSDLRRGNGEGPDGRDTALHVPRSASDVERGIENTRSALINGAANARKTVKWAVPLSPARSRSRSFGSTATTSPSSSLDRSFATSTHRIPPRLALNRTKARSPSSPTPPSSSTRARDIRTAKSLSKASRILKARPAIVIPTSSKLAGPAKARPSRTVIPASTSAHRSMAGSGLLSSAETKVPRAPSVPPRSPLRQSSTRVHEQPTSAKPREVAGTLRLKSSTSRNYGGSRGDNALVTTVPQFSSATNVRLYDCTTPVRPLNVVKKGVPRSPNTPKANPPSIVLSSPPLTVEKQKSGSIDAKGRQVSSVAFPQRPRSPLSPIELDVSLVLPPLPEGVNASSMPPTSSYIPSGSNGEPQQLEYTANIERGGTEIKARVPVAQCKARRSQSSTPQSCSTQQYTDSTSALGDCQGRLTHIIPPARKSSLLPPPNATLPISLPQQKPGPSHPDHPGPSKLRNTQLPTPNPTPPKTANLRLHKTIAAVAQSAAQLTSEAVGVAQKGEDMAQKSSTPAAGKSSSSIPTLAASKAAGPATPIRKPVSRSTVQSESVGTTPPLLKLKLSILPPSSLVRSFSKSKRRLVDAEAQLPTARGTLESDEDVGAGERKGRVVSIEMLRSVKAPKALPRQVHVKNGVKHRESSTGILI